MIKLKDILLESDAPNLLIPRRTEGRLDKMIQQYIKKGSKGDLELRDMDLTILPKALKHVDVDGNFFCCGNDLKTLENAPRSVRGAFHCTNNILETLEGCPEYVGDNFYCYYNKLTSLKGAPNKISGHFFCNHNELTSLEGAPIRVTGNFNCKRNFLTSLKGAPKYVGGYFDCSFNSTVFTLEDVDAVCKVPGRTYVGGVEY